MLVVSITPVSAAITLGQGPRVAAPARTDRPANIDRPATPSLTGLTRPLLDPATQLAAQDIRQNSRSDANEPSQEEQAQIQSLRRRDAEVRQHERAHSGAGGPYTGQPVYEYVSGPDGKRYAVSGEVSIDASPAGTPEATIQKMEVVIRAALAPADPSAQDQRVASQARQIKAEAVAEKNTEEREENEKAAERTDDPVGVVVDRAVSAYRQVSELVAEPLGLVTLPPSVEIFA